MKYMGSKNRIAKYIVPIIQEYIDKYEITTYIEPFVGGANVIDKVECKRKIGCDLQHYLIELYKESDKIDELGDTVEKELYLDVKREYKNNTGKYDDWYIGAIGFFASYNGKFFDGGYAASAKTKDGKIRNYYDEAKRNFLKQRTKLKGVIWKEGTYRDTVNNLSSSLIYCDPPYQKTTGYSSSKCFNHEEFWEWCREKSRNNIVLISEENAPNDFVCIWEQEVRRSLDGNKGDKATEKLFIHNSLIK